VDASVEPDPVTPVSPEPEVLAEVSVSEAAPETRGMSIETVAERPELVPLPPDEQRKRDFEEIDNRAEADVTRQVRGRERDAGR
jgi:hypothetical protein